MRNLLFAISTLMISALVFSCEKEIILDIPAGDIDPVVESWIYDGSSPLVMIAKQFAGYGTFNQSTLTDSLNVRGATVTVNAVGGTPVQLQEVNIFELPDDLLDQYLDNIRTPRIFGDLLPFFEGLSVEDQINAAIAFLPADADQSEIDQVTSFVTLINTFNFYVDTTNAIIGQGGVSYELNIDIDGNQLSAVTQIPPKQDINFMFYEINDDDPNFADVFVNLTVPNNFDAFVLLSNRRSDTAAFYIPDYFSGGLSDNGIYAGSGTIDLPLLRGYADGEDPDLGVLGLFEVGDVVTLKWQNIDEATYNFWFSVFNDGGDTPFSSATLIQGNINGGVGIWAGYNTSYTTITIQ